MDFAWSDQQRELLDAVGRFASQQLNYDVIENDRKGVFNHEAWKKCGDFGIQGLLVTTGPVADLLVVFATVDKTRGPDGISAFLVEKDSPGMNVARKLEKMGVRTSPMAEVFFENCEVPEENLLGKEGGGAFLFTRSMTWERGCILASA